MYETFLLTIIALPGSALQVPFLILLALFCLRGAWLAFRSKGYLQHGLTFGLGFIFIIVFCLVGLVNGNNTENVFREGLAYTASIGATAFLITGYRFAKQVQLIVLLGFGLYMALKVFLYFVLALGLINPLDFYIEIKTYIPAAVVSSLYSGNAPRVVFSNDFLMPIFLYWLAAMYSLQKISRNMFFLMSFITFIVVALSLSRYLYIATLISGISIAYLFMSGRSILVMFLLSAVSVVLIPLALQSLGYDALIVDRMGSGGSGQVSNSLKFEQLGLLDRFQESPLIGNGLGFDLQVGGRELADSFQTEVQWLGMMVKTGTVGIFFGAAIVFHICKQILVADRQSGTKICLPLIPIFAAWLLAGWTNPVIFLVTSSVNYLLIYSVVNESGHSTGYQAKKSARKRTNTNRQSRRTTTQ